MIDLRSVLFAALFGLIAFSCAATREGWGKGRFVVVRDYKRLQVRRSPVRIDAPDNELVLSWIGARALDGMPDILECSFTAFDDRNKDGKPQADEIVKQRTSFDRVRKVMFDDLRFAESARTYPLSALFIVRTERERREIRFPLVPD